MQNIYQSRDLITSITNGLPDFSSMHKPPSEWMNVRMLNSTINYNANPPSFFIQCPYTDFNQPPDDNISIQLMKHYIKHMMREELQVCVN